MQNNSCRLFARFLRVAASSNPLNKVCEGMVYEGDFETVARLLNPTDAYIVCSCLEAAGVPAVVADANLAQVNSLWAIAIGGTRVLVTASRVAEAKKVIDAFNRGDFALPNGSDSYRD